MGTASFRRDGTNGFCLSARPIPFIAIVELHRGEFEGARWQHPNLVLQNPLGKRPWKGSFEREKRLLLECSLLRPERFGLHRMRLELRLQKPIPLFRVHHHCNQNFHRNLENSRSKMAGRQPSFTELFGKMTLNRRIERDNRFVERLLLCEALLEPHKVALEVHLKTWVRSADLRA